MILTGDVCHPRAAPFINSIVTSNLTLPLDLYFIDNSTFSPVLKKLHPKGTEIVPQFHYLGNKGICELKGLKVAYFNCYDKKQSS